MHNFTSADEATNWCRVAAGWNDACLWVGGVRYFYGPAGVGMHPTAIVVPITSIAHAISLPRTRNGVETFE